MSVIVKGMKIPETCEDCPLNYNEMSCIVTGTRWWSDTMVLLDFDYQKERLHDCPLSEVPTTQPEPCEDAVSREMIMRHYDSGEYKHVNHISRNGLLDYIEQLPSVTPKTEQRWIPVTLETLPNPGSVVVVCGKKGTWDYGTYRGWYGDIHSWWWKKNTIKDVYWWMLKADALPDPFMEEGE